MQKYIAFLASAIVLTGSVTCRAIEVFTGKSITHVSDFYLNLPQFDPSKAVNGDVTEPSDDSGLNEWLANDGVLGANFTVDLGDTYFLNSLSLYNTHNGGWNDRSTGDFAIHGSTSIDGTGQLDGTVTQLLTGTLSNVDGQASITPDVFTSGNGLDTATGVRYVRFTAVTIMDGKLSAGLNEISGDGTLVPEPGSIGLIAMASALLLRRRR